MGDRPAHKLPFGLKCHDYLLYYTRTCKSVGRHVFRYCIISKTKKEFRENTEENIWTGPSLYTIIWTGSLTKTNMENIDVKYNIRLYFLTIGCMNFVIDIVSIAYGTTLTVKEFMLSTGSDSYLISGDFVLYVLSVD